MQPETNFMTNSHRAHLNDQSFDLHLSESFDDDDAASTGWTWVAAVLIGGALIVSGYLDQEAQSFERGTASAVERRGGSYATASLAAPKVPNQTTQRVDKGY